MNSVAFVGIIFELPREVNSSKTGLQIVTVCTNSNLLLNFLGVWWWRCNSNWVKISLFLDCHWPYKSTSFCLEFFAFISIWMPATNWSALRSRDLILASKGYLNSLACIFLGRLIEGNCQFLVFFFINRHLSRLDQWHQSLLQSHLHQRSGTSSQGIERYKTYLLQLEHLLNPARLEATC